ncbi:MAG: thioredoxin domain-containing protein [Candidatus Solibacter sp.]
MLFPTSRSCLIGAIVLGGAALLLAQEWQTVTNLAGVDFTGLTPAKKNLALKALRAGECSCGCGMKVAECRVKDPNCSFSRGLAGVTVAAIKAGKTEAAAIAEAKASKFGTRPPAKLLDDPVAIPTLGAPSIGPASAKVTLVEFSDFQCPYCSKAVLQIAATLKAYPNDVRLIFKQYPLDSHPQATISAQASLAAHAQGKFWPLHDLMFANRTKLSRENIMRWAKDIDLDLTRFMNDMESAETKKTVSRDQADGDKAGVEGTPTVFINGQRYNGDLAPEAIKSVIDAEIKRVSAAGAKK